MSIRSIVITIVTLIDDVNRRQNKWSDDRNNPFNRDSERGELRGGLGLGRVKLGLQVQWQKRARTEVVNSDWIDLRPTGLA